jgi:Rps23 Pro-64 3,4-dihydroxylase Tpa1-like proline 4-hydroxylase
MRNFLFEHDNVLTKEQCQNIIDAFEKCDLKKEGWIGEGRANFDIKRSMDLSVTRDLVEKFKDFKEIDKILTSKLTTMLNEYVKHLCKEFEYFEPDNWCTLFNNMEDTGYQIQRVDPGGFYNWHSDYQPFNHRILTFIWYLNDVDEKNGGSTEFYDGRAIQPKTGKFIMFPATWTEVHRGAVLKSGKKYIVTGWLYYNKD